MFTNCPECGYLFAIDEKTKSTILYCSRCEARLKIINRTPFILQYEEDTSKFALKTEISEVRILDTTLREGEQFAHAQFSTAERMRIVELLEDFGVDAIEVTTPISSEQNFQDAKSICSLGLRARVFAHARCVQADIARAAESGVDGVNILFGVSKLLQRHSHGKDIEQVRDRALEVIGWTRKEFPHLEVRFSAEDAFRSDVQELLYLYRSLRNHVDRFGIPDTTGIATPMQVYRLSKFLKRKFHLPLEFHGHNDTGCAVANALSFLEGGGLYVNTTILGIGERNGICSLSGLISRIYPLLPTLSQKYDFSQLIRLDRLVASYVGVEIPFTQPLTSTTAFTHKAGIHTKAVLQNPESYEVFDPTLFGMERTIHYASSITGKHAIRQRLRELGHPTVSEETLVKITQYMKNAASEKRLSQQDFDSELLSLCS